MPSRLILDRSVFPKSSDRRHPDAWRSRSEVWVSPARIRIAGSAGNEMGLQDLIGDAARMVNAIVEMPREPTNAV